jgi:hypothetical protein
MLIQRPPPAACLPDDMPPALPSAEALAQLIRDGRDALDAADIRAVLGLPPAPPATPGVGAGVEPGASLYRRRAPAAASSSSPARALPTPEST